MVYYWIITYILMFFAIFQIHNSQDIKVKGLNTYFFMIGILMLIIFSGMRGAGTGIDDHQYISFFDQSSPGVRFFDFSHMENNYRYEKFFLLLAYFFSDVTNNGYVFLFFIAVLSISVNAITYRKTCQLFLVALCVYSSHLFINKDMNQIRFGLSSAFGMMAIILFLERKYIIAMVFFIISTQFHSTGFALLLFLPLILIPNKRWIPLSIVLISLPIGIIGGKSLILDHIGIISDLASRVNSYEGTGFDTEIPVFSLGNMKNIVFISIYSVFVLKETYDYKLNRIQYGFILFYAVGASVRIIFSDFSIIGGRVGNLFLQVEPIIISIIIYKMKNKYLGTFLLVGIVSYYLLYNTVLSAQSITGYNVSPYFSIF